MATARKKKDFELFPGRRMSEEQSRIHKEASDVIGRSFAVSKIEAEKIMPLAESLVSFVSNNVATNETKVKVIDHLSELVSATNFSAKQREKLFSKLEAAVKKNGGIEVWNSFLGFERALEGREALEASQTSIVDFAPKRERRK